MTDTQSEQDKQREAFEVATTIPYGVEWKEGRYRAKEGSGDGRWVTAKAYQHDWETWQAALSHAAQAKPAELTEAMIDAPRGFLLGLEGNIRDLKRMRQHLDLGGWDYSCWPEWAKKEDGHITKAGKAILIYTMMENAK